MKAYPIIDLCKVMGVSQGCSYYYLNRCKTHFKDPYQAALEGRTKELFDHSKTSYGSRRIVENCNLSDTE